MYDRVVLAAVSSNASGPSGSTLIIIAIVSALGIVLAAALPALLSTREREPRAARDMRSQRDKLQRKVDWRDRYIENLEAISWEHGIDPRTVKPADEP